MNHENTPTERKLWYDGPNYTADAVIIQPEKHTVLLIQRSDTGEWALPGGFIDKNESSLAAARRETEEETGVVITSNGNVVYQGPVEDPRNSSTAWIETSAYLFLVPTEVSTRGSDDAVDAAWKSIDTLPKLYGSHAQIIKSALNTLQHKNPRA